MLSDADAAVQASVARLRLGGLREFVGAAPTAFPSGNGRKRPMILGLVCAAMMGGNDNHGAAVCRNHTDLRVNSREDHKILVL